MTLSYLPLAQAALELARDEFPGVVVQDYLNQIEGLVRRIRRRAGKKASNLKLFQSLRTVLFTQMGFRGNSYDYYDTRNYFLNQVLDRRTGLPMAMSILVLDLAHRLGLRAWGLSLPTHFLVEIEIDSQRKTTRILDPFHGGLVVTRAELQGYLRAEVEKLERVHDPRLVLSRLLNHLKVVYWSERHYQKAVRVMGRLLELNPGDLAEYRDRGLAYQQLGEWGRALLDFERFLTVTEKNPNFTTPDERSWIQEVVGWIKGQSAHSQLVH